MPTGDALELALGRFAKDPELQAELRARLTPGPALASVEEGRVLPAAAFEVVDTGSHGVEETIVRPMARPVMVIRNNAATTTALGPDSQVWASRIEAARGHLDRAIRAVGRVEAKNHPDFPWLGTGWLVDRDVMVTNRHVAREFARRGGTGFTFRMGRNGQPISARIDFLEEFDRANASEFEITQILWIASPDEPDVAFFQVKPATDGRTLPAPIALAETINEDDFVATIGYPARDDRVPDQQLVLKVFGDVYDKKRLAPGTIMALRGDELEHDCSTLGGNSGSAVVSLRSGEAVGLHFSGLYMEANFAVAAPKLRELMGKIERLERVVPVDAPADAAKLAPAPPPAAEGTTTFKLNIPLEITVKVGGVVVVGQAAPAIDQNAALPFEAALKAAQDALATHPDVLEVRSGYRFRRGWITNERVIVVEVREKRSIAELRSAGSSEIPPMIHGVGVDVRTAPLRTQLEGLGLDLSMLEARDKPGAYREPKPTKDFELTPVNEAMKATFHVSPDSGFPNLKAFLGRVKKHLTATMYEWEAAHISEAIRAAIAPAKRRLKMVTQRTGTAEAVAALQAELGERFEHAWASVGSGKLIPSAYHIKVASRDGEELWLSSGNWKDSNQPDIDPAGEGSTSITPLHKHNREWHAIIENATLAGLFQRYIEFDFDEAQRVPLEEGFEAPFPDLFVPEAVFATAEGRAVRAKYFSPLVINRVIDVQPLLTPDRDQRGRHLFIAQATEMVKQAREQIYVQNQSFNLLEDNADEFEAFFVALRDQQRAGLDVRVIMRDARQFGGEAMVNQQRLLERIKDFGISTDTEHFRLQQLCHTKGIIIDTKTVMLGSQNLTNSGGLYNRDASLLVRDAEVAKYFEEVFLFDWEVLAHQEADELIGGVRLASPGEATPPGYRRVSLTEALGLN